MLYSVKTKKEEEEEEGEKRKKRLIIRIIAWRLAAINGSVLPNSGVRMAAVWNKMVVDFCSRELLTFDKQSFVYFHDRFES